MNPIDDPLGFKGDSDRDNVYMPGKTIGDIRYPYPQTEEFAADGGTQPENTESDPSLEIDNSLSPEAVHVEELLEILPEEEKRLQDKEGYTPRGLMKAAEIAQQESFYCENQTLANTDYTINELAKDSSAEKSHKALERLTGAYLEKFNLNIHRSNSVIEMPFYRPKNRENF